MIIMNNDLNTLWFYTMLQGSIVHLCTVSSQAYQQFEDQMYKSSNLKEIRQDSYHEGSHLEEAPMHLLQPFSK